MNRIFSSYISLLPPHQSVRFNSLVMATNHHLHLPSPPNTSTTPANQAGKDRREVSSLWRSTLGVSNVFTIGKIFAVKVLGKKKLYK